METVSERGNRQLLWVLAFMCPEMIIVLLIISLKNEAFVPFVSVHDGTFAGPRMRTAESVWLPSLSSHAIDLLPSGPSVASSTVP